MKMIYLRLMRVDINLHESIREEEGRVFNQSGFHYWENGLVFELRVLGEKW